MEKPDIEKLVNGAVEMGIDLSQRQVDQFALFSSLLQEWNRRMNLTRISVEDTVPKHFLDSLTIGIIPNFKGEGHLIDVGTGAGFPGIPLKIAYPELDVTLMDSTRKKLTFLDSVIEALQLHGVRTLHSRAEDAGKDAIHRERYDWVTARAVAETGALMEWLIPLAKRGGRIVAMKSPHAKDEISKASSVIRKLGGSEPETIQVNLPGSDIVRILALVTKVSPTPRESISNAKRLSGDGAGMKKRAKQHTRKG